MFRKQVRHAMQRTLLADATGAIGDKAPRVICLALVLLLPSATHADTVTLVSNRDTTIYQDAPSNSNGAGQTMFVGTVQTMRQSSPRRALIGFDIAGNVPAGATITGVQLRLVLDRAAPGASGARPIELHRLLADWGEGITGRGRGGPGSGEGFPTAPDGTTATWSHRFFNSMPWNNPGGDFEPSASGSAMVGTASNKAAVWDSTPAMVNDVLTWLDNPASNFGWLLLGDESATATARRFFTREAGRMASRPSLDITFTPPSPPATRLVVSASASVIAGSSFDVSVTAVDNSGNVVPGYGGTVTFSSTDAYPGMLPADYTFTAGDQGSHTFSSVMLFTAGMQTLTGQDKADGSIAGSAMVAVNAAPADHFLLTAPATAVSGTPFDVTLTALDPYGNVDTNYGGTVTWATGDTDPGVLLPADYTFQAADNGMYTFQGGVTLITVGDQTLAATDTVSGITGLATVTIVPGP